ncbi:hypothetical protein ABIC28_005176 [Rhodococcus sp. PvR044]|uniref:hypothetical protein n=1 Tax=Rhodococcus sp. PvR044 TaxID=3156402 RepID=UPI003394DD34
MRSGDAPRSLAAATNTNTERLDMAAATTPFHLDQDNLDAAGFLAGVRRTLVAAGQPGTAATGLVSHIDVLLAEIGVEADSVVIDARAAEINFNLRRALGLSWGSHRG